MQNENKLGVMPIKKLIWDMSLPIIASMLVQALYNIVDSVFVSWVSEASLTAVSLAFPAQNLMISLSAGTAVGVNALMGRALGAKQQKRADTVAVNGLFLAFVGFLLCAVLGLSLSDLFFRSQTDVEEIVQMGNQYLHIVMGCSIGLFGQMMLERLLQGTGHSVLSMYTQGAGALINLILDPVFIFLFDLGVAGAAIATVAGQICACVFALVLNLKKNPEIHLVFRGFQPDWRIIGSIYAIGLPSVVMMAIGSVMTFLMNKILITYHAAHETAATAFGVFFKINSLIFMPVFGLNNGVVPIVAYNYGAQKRERMMQTVKIAVSIAVGLMTIGMLAFLLIPGPLLRIFIQNATDEVMATMMRIGIPALRIICTHFVMAAVSISFNAVFQALGKGTYAMITSICRQLVILLPAAFVLAKIGMAVGNDNLVWLSFPIAEVASLIVSCTLYRRLYKNVISKVGEGVPPQAA